MISIPENLTNLPKVVKIFYRLKKQRESNSFYNDDLLAVEIYSRLHKRKLYSHCDILREFALKEFGCEIYIFNKDCKQFIDVGSWYTFRPSLDFNRTDALDFPGRFVQIPI